LTLDLEAHYRIVEDNFLHVQLFEDVRYEEMSNEPAEKGE
jgi:hypothetical protein